MGLLIDNREALGTSPGLHALIIGVSSYRHLPGGSGETATETFGFNNQLSAAALSACQFYRWVIASRTRFPVPLATVRLLLSPTAREEEIEAKIVTNSQLSPGTREHVQRASFDWREDAATHRDGMTVFYYAGYGIGSPNNDAILLLEDFGDPRQPLLQNVASFSSLFGGMSVTRRSPEIARTQLYFVDTNRIVPPQPIYTQPPVMFDIEFGRRDDRAAPVFFAAVPGGTAYARTGEGGLFTTALLEGLGGDAAEPTGESGGSKRLWQVTVSSLSRHLEGCFDRLAQEIHIEQEHVSVEGLFKDVPIVYLDETPKGNILVFQRTPTAKAREPGLHALIAGVSSYLHLPGGASREARLTLGLKQLSAAALSAYHVYQWLVKRAPDLALPLASVRLVVSPSIGELSSEDGLAGKDPCTTNKFLAAATEWRKEAATHRENMTLFYFAGHGAQRSKGDTVLLMEDFADEYGGLLKNAIEFRSVFEGMAPSPHSGNLPRKQLYFLDTCRTRPEEFMFYEKMPATQAFDIEVDARDDRKAPVFAAAVPGSSAYSRTGKQSLFAEALLTSLESAFAPEATRRQVTVLSLSQDIDAFLEAQEDANQEFTLEGRTKGGDDLVICTSRT